MGIREIDKEKERERLWKNKRTTKKIVDSARGWRGYILWGQSMWEGLISKIIPRTIRR